MTDHSNMHLGLRHRLTPAHLDPHTLKLADYMPPFTPPADWPGWSPAVVKTGEEWGEDGNDMCGDCVFAAAAHLIMSRTSNAGQIIAPSASFVIGCYSAVTGYVPGNPATDHGTLIDDMLAYWQVNGCAGHKLLCSLAIDPENRAEVLAGMYLFGGVLWGLSLPLAAQRMDVWDLNDFQRFMSQFNKELRPGSWGGHCVCSVTPGKCVTWGEDKSLTDAVTGTYATDCRAVVTPEWIKADSLAPSGFNVAQLLADAAAMNGG